VTTAISSDPQVNFQSCATGGRAVLSDTAKHIWRVYCLDKTTGKELRRIADYAEVRVPAPIAAHGLIFISGGAPRGRHFFAVRPGGSGNISLDEGGNSHPLMAWQVSKGGPYTPTPIVYGDYLYVCADNGVLSCYRAQTGELVYQNRISETGGSYSASPIAADGKLYLASEDGEACVMFFPTLCVNIHRAKDLTQRAQRR
jgi:outer membrane protein assembly factor BamB